MANRLVSTEISKWKGINSLLSAGIPEEYAEDMVNFHVGDDGSLTTRQGHGMKIKFDECITGDFVQKVLFCRIKNTDAVVILGEYNYAVYSVSGDTYTLEKSDSVPAGAEYFTGDAEILEFDFKTYLISGQKFFVFGDGNDDYALKAADAYVPAIEITTPPSGGGELYESINLLSGRRRVLYSTLQNTSQFKLPEKASSIVSATLNGTDVTANVIFTSGTDTFTSAEAGAAASGINNFEVVYACEDEVYEAQLSSLPNQLRPVKYAGATDTQVFYYEGNTDYAQINERNYVYYSDIGQSGPDPTYIAAENYVTIGDSSPITDIVRMYDRLIVFTKNSAWFIGYTSVTLDEVTKNAYTVHSLNDSIGCYVPKTALLLDNTAATASDKDFYIWTSTNVKDERNAVIASGVIKGYEGVFGSPTLAVLDDDYRKEAWFAVRTSGAERNALIYNYSLGIWYRFVINTGEDAGYTNGLLMIRKNPAFYTNTGLYVFDDRYDVDDKNGSDTKINAEVTFRPFYFGRPEFRKNSYRFFVTVKPKSASFTTPAPSMTVMVSSDNSPLSDKISSTVDLTDNTTVVRADFAGFTFRRRCCFRRFYSIQMTLETNAPLTVKKVRFDAEITDRK